MATTALPLKPAPAPARWLPRSLFGRLMLVLATGLALAQLLSAAINVAERGQLLDRSFGMQPAQRIADVVRLLDGLPGAERERVVTLFSAPPLVVSLHDAPSVTDAAAGSDRSRMFAARLRSTLGDERALRVESRSGFAIDSALMGAARGRLGMMGGDTAHRMGSGPGFGAGMGGAAGMGLAVARTEVHLRDGRWARFDTELPATADALPWRLVLTLAVLLLATLGLSWLAVRWVVQPLRVLAQAAQSLGEDLARPPLSEDGPTEVRQATQAFNTMQRRLAQFIDERTRMLTALSHDLKTPLTRMRLRTELLDDDEARTRFESDLQEMETMVAQTLDFMRGLGGHEARVPVDVNALLRALQADQQAMGRRVAVVGQALQPYMGVPTLLRRALGNLVDNAVLYGGSATLRVEDTPERLTLKVLDEGPGLPPAELERVFEPFYRVEASRNRATGGTGLGLGIVRSIARLHGGDVVLHNRPLGGLAAVLSLPRRPGGQAAAGAPGAVPGTR
ncbi:MAG: ATP-binding protein [Rubrivivax sp.]|nr:ATP-binding protein [Rubrivivax sp.]